MYASGDCLRAHRLLAPGPPRPLTFAARVQIAGSLMDPTEALVNRALAAAQAAVAKGEPQGPALLQQVRITGVAQAQTPATLALKARTEGPRKARDAAAGARGSHAVQRVFASPCSANMPPPA
jgi:hypothetical protein